MTNASTNDPQLFQDFLEFQRLRAQGALSTLAPVETPTAVQAPPARADEAAAESRPRPRRQRDSREWFTPVFDTRVLRPLVKPFLGFLNFFGLVVSLTTTISVALWAENILTGRMTWIGGVVGAIVAGVFTAGQWVCLAGFRNEWLGVRWRWLFGYLFFLAPDILISWVESWRWVVYPLTFAATKTLSDTSRLAIMWCMGILAAGLTTASSVFPERFLFGKIRRR